MQQRNNFFICGTVDRKTGRRYVFSATTQGRGTVKQVENFTPNGAVRYELDWGEAATHEAAIRVAGLILASVINQSTAERLKYEFADDVVKQLESDHMWLLNMGDLQLWLRGKVKVA